MNKTLKQTLITEWDNFVQYIKLSKFQIAVISFFILLTYGVKLFYFSFSIDTEVMMNNYQDQLKAYESQGRLGIVILKKLLFPTMFNPFVANFLTYVTFALTGVLLCYFVHRVLNFKPKNIAILIIPVLFLTQPNFAEQFNFILQSFEVSLGILFLVSSLLLSYLYIVKSYKIFALLSVVLNIWSFLIYQSLISFYITGAVISFLLILYRDQRESSIKIEKKYFSIILKYIIIFSASFILSQLIVLINTKIVGLSPYITNQILWGKAPTSRVIFSIFKQIYYIVFAKNMFYNYSFLISSILVMMILFVKLIKKNQTVFFEIIGFALLLISPFFMTIVLGHGEPIRAQLPAIQFVIAFNFYYVYLYLKNKILKVSLVLACIIIGFSQSIFTADLLFSEYMKYNEDVTFANRLNSQLDSMGIGDRVHYSLVILGSHQPESINVRQAEVLGRSFFGWDIKSNQGVSFRAIGFMRTLGYEFQYPQSSQIHYARSISDKMTIWPTKNSVKIHDRLIIIKLSN